MISLRAITEENFDAVIRMKRPDGEGFVAPNVYSLAQCWLYREDGDVFPCAVYHDDEPVGFLLLEEDGEERELVVWRIMFPEEHTNKGYGGETIRQIIELAQESGKYDKLTLICKPENARARHLYDSLGFRPTGQVLYGEDELELKV